MLFITVVQTVMRQFDTLVTKQESVSVTSYMILMTQEGSILKSRSNILTQGKFFLFDRLT